MKYIDADRLREKIERRLDELNPKTGMFGDRPLRAVNPKTFPRESELEKVLHLIDSLQQEQPELPQIGYAETYYQRGLRDGIIKGRINILSVLEDIEKGKAKPVLVIKEQDQPEVDLEKEIDAFFDKWDKNSNGCIFDENGAPVTIKTIKGVVKHFLNARKEE